MLENPKTDNDHHNRYCAVFWNQPQGLETDNLSKLCDLKFVLEIAQAPTLTSLGFVYEEVYVGRKPFAILSSLSLNMVYKFRLYIRYERTVADQTSGNLTTRVYNSGE